MDIKISIVLKDKTYGFSDLLVCPNNEQHIVKKEGVGKYCMVCGLLK